MTIGTRIPSLPLRMAGSKALDSVERFLFVYHAVVVLGVL